MSFSDALRLLARHWLLLVLVPLVLGVSAFVFARRIPKVYNSDTTIYTGIASGYDIVHGDATADYNVTNNAFDNLINLITARSTKVEVVYRLVAQHLWQLHQHPALGATLPYSSLQDVLPAPLRQQLLGASEAATLDNVRRTATSNEDNAIARLVNSGDATYSLDALSHLTASRINISDLVKLEFESYDPEVCRRTLQLVTEVFLDQSRNLREGQTASVIKYYEDELARNKAQMEKTENAILAFNREHNIINYETQSNNAANNKDALTADMTALSQQYAGAQAALNAISGKIGHRESTLLSSRQMLDQRQKLNRLNAALTDAQLQDGGNSVKVKQLQAEADRTAQAMQQNVDTYYAQSTSTDGIPSKDLMSEWVQDMVLVETNRAKLGVMKKRLGEFESEYQRMAPLGATIKKLERDNELAEKAYLATLASLNSSKASMQNTQLASKVKIIDAPNMPTSPKNGKLLPIVGLSTLGGLVFVAGLVLGLGLLDKSLKTPAAAARQIGLPVAGIMLDAHTTPPKLLQASQQRSLDQLVRHILIQANTPPAASPFVVGVFSVQHQESKTTLCQALAQRCHQMGVSTLALYPNASGIAPDTQDPIETPSLYYSPEVAASRGWPLDELIQNAMPKHMQETSSPSIKVVLVEFPALRESLLPVGVLRELSLVFLTVPANRPWSQADQQTIERLRAATAAPVEVVLFGVAAHHEEMV